MELLPLSQAVEAPELTREHLQRLRADHHLYCRAALKIQTKAGRMARFEPNFAQEYVRTKIEEQRERTGKVRVLILKARQEGISTWCASRIYRGCTLWGNKRGLVLADKLDRAGDIFGIYERYDREVPDELRPPRKSTRGAREMSWKTDSRITVETAGDPDAGRGSTVHYLHASEIAVWPKADETWTALMQAVPTEGGEVYVESTAKGVGNLFHRLWLLAESGLSEWMPIFLPWWVHAEYQREVTEGEWDEIKYSSDPWERKAMDEGIYWEGRFHRLSINQIAWRRGKIRDDFLGDERTFRQEYPSNAREAFVLSGDTFFDVGALEEYEQRAKAPIRRGTFVKIGQGFKLQASERGYVKVWEMPDDDGHYVLGADTAEGKAAAAVDASLSDPEAERGGRDFSSADIIKVSELEEDPDRPGHKRRVPVLRQVAQIHGRMAPEVFAEQIYYATSWWSCPGPEQMRTMREQALTGIERNHSSGQTAISLLKDVWKHRNLFVHRRINVRGAKISSYYGWVTDGTTRMPMLDDLAALVRNQQVEIFSADTIRELFGFVRGDDGRPEAQEGTHDDRVISFAIGVQMTLHHRNQVTGAMPEPEVADTPTGL
jgi:hypothetical protein